MEGEKGGCKDAHEHKQYPRHNIYDIHIHLLIVRTIHKTQPTKIMHKTHTHLLLAYALTQTMHKTHTHLLFVSMGVWSGRDQFSQQEGVLAHPLHRFDQKGGQRQSCRRVCVLVCLLCMCMCVCTCRVYVHGVWCVYVRGVCVYVYA